MSDELPRAAYFDAGLVSVMEALRDDVLRISTDVRLLFITNLRSGEELQDIGPDGIVNAAQYHTRSQADEIIGSFESLGITVQAFFSEQEFLRWALSTEVRALARTVIVYSMAEAGTGAGRRALIPAACNLLGVPVFNSGPHACSLAQHKFHANAVLRRVGVRVPTTWFFKDGAWLNDEAPSIGSRVILKPTYESMSIGVCEESVKIVEPDFDSFAASTYLRYRQPLVAQEFISGDEVGVPLVRIQSTHALPAVAIRRADGREYGARPKTFFAQNVAHDTSHGVFEATAAQYAALERAAILAFDALDMEGVGRIDLRVDVDGRAWVFDTNVSPPPLKGTSYAIAMARLGFSVEDMLAIWLGASLRRYGILPRA